MKTEIHTWKKRTTILEAKLNVEISKFESELKDFKTQLGNQKPSFE